MDHGLRIKGRSYSGINEIRIKCIKPSYVWDVIGISSDITECKTGLRINYTPRGNFYFFFKDVGIDEYIDGEFKTLHQTNLSWKSNDVITIKIDCDKWNVSFFLNDVLIGGTVKIQPG